jgi:AcrR family transcriptional regulator
MRYRPEHKVETHQKIIKDASRRIRAEGLNGAAVSAVMKDAGLTHGGFYKHFENKDDLLLESLREGFREIEDTLVHAAEQSPRGEAWKAVVETYLSLELCEHPERGCPLAALSPELARAEEDEAADRGGISGLQEPNVAVHAWPADRGPRTRFLRDFFNNDRGGCNCSTTAGSRDARESAGEHERFSLAQLLTPWRSRKRRLEFRRLLRQRTGLIKGWMSARVSAPVRPSCPLHVGGCRPEPTRTREIIKAMLSIPQR